MPGIPRDHSPTRCPRRATCRRTPRSGNSTRTARSCSSTTCSGTSCGRFPPRDCAGNSSRTCARLRERTAASWASPSVYTAQPGGMTDEQRGLLKDFWGPGMRVDPADRQVVDELAPGRGDWYFTKWRYSAFFRSGLLEQMREHGRDQLIVCGVYAHVGVLMTAVEAFTNDIQHLPGRPTPWPTSPRRTTGWPSSTRHSAAPSSR